MSLSTACSASTEPTRCSTSTACCRRLSSAWSRIGRFSQRRSCRLPIAVAQRSMRPASVYSARPPKLASISRLRRVCASRMTACSRRSRVSARKCGSAAALRVLRVLQQAARRADAGRRVLGVEAREIERAELLAEQAFAGAGIEMPRRAAAHARERREPRRRVVILREQQLGGFQALDLRVQRFQVRELREAEPAAREVEPREPDARRERHRREQARLA